MPLPERLRNLLDSRGAQFTLTSHPDAYTARAVAAAEQIAQRAMVKTVVVRCDGACSMLAIAANRSLDMHEVRTALGVAQARLATEKELAELFPDCELGAMPPIGSLYGMPVYLDRGLAWMDTIAFNAGTHREVIHMTMAEYRRLANPVVLPLAREEAFERGW